MPLLDAYAASYTAINFRMQHSLPSMKAYFNCRHVKMLLLSVSCGCHQVFKAPMSFHLDLAKGSRYTWLELKKWKPLFSADTCIELALALPL